MIFSRSRSWVEEEGEVFRKGTVLLGPEEMEGDYDSEELRREVSISVQYPAMSLRLIDVGVYSCWTRWLNAHHLGLSTSTTSVLKSRQTFFHCPRRRRWKSHRRDLTYAARAHRRRLSAPRTRSRNHCR